MPETPIDPALLLTGFPAVIDEQTHTLILGSFPGAASLRAQEYYAFPQNQFWRLLSGVLQTQLVGLPYPERLQILLRHRLGVWDVYQACMRDGSLDSAIKQGRMNDFSALRQRYPQLRTLAFNGQTAGKIRTQFEQQGYQTRQLPSSSPAYAAMKFDDKLQIWRQMLCENTSATPDC